MFRNIIFHITSQTKMIILWMGVILLSVSPVIADEGMDHDAMMDHADSELPNVGNKICPVSVEVIAEMGDGKGMQVEHEGKAYNLCCAMCVKDFKKDPAMYIQKINGELENSDDAAHGDDGNAHSEHGN